MSHRYAVAAALLSTAVLSIPAHAAPAPSKEDVAGALHKAVAFFRERVSVQGGYLWRYSEDLARREGEGKARATTAWVQPPGTPTIGNAYLDVYELTNDEYCLDAAKESAHALVKGQMRSGGWDYRIEFDPETRKRRAYRTGPDGAEGGNVTTLDDNTTQSALRFLMRVDQTLELKDEAIHEAATYALGCLLKAQYPIGAWPQRYSAFPNPEDYPVKKADYPETWTRAYVGKDYKGYYTFNDNTISDMIATMFDAAKTYGDERYRAAAEKAGGFILLAQMPEPQPAWAQQYDADMHPAWARKFEPPAVTGGESHGVMRTLLSLYRETGEERYLEPLPRALEYLKSSRLSGGGLARFYELRTNTPLYFTKEYALTYSSDDMPTHYGFIVGDGLDAIEAEYRAAKAGDRAKRAPSEKAPPAMTPELAARAKAIVDRMDERGAWVEEGGLSYHGPDDPTTRVIECSTFAANVRTLAEFLAAE